MTLALILTILACFGSLLYLYKREKKRFFNYMRENLDPEKSSQIYGVTNVFAQQLGHAVLASVKGTGMGKASGTARLEKAVDAAIVKDSIGLQSPELAAILQLFPGVNKIIDKNPLAAGFAAQKLAEILGKGSGGNHAEGKVIQQL